MTAHDRVETLHRLGMLSDAQRDAAATRLREMGVPDFSTDGAALEWLIQQQVITLRQLAEQPVDMDDPEVNRVLDEWGDHSDSARRAGDATPSSRPPAGGSSFGGMLAWGGVAAAVLAVVLYMVLPASIPACGDKGVVATLKSMAQDVARPDPVRDLMSMRDNTDARAALLLARVTGAKEIGYDRESKVRACTAVMEVGDERVPLAYTVAPGEDDEIYVRGDDAMWLTARYGGQRKADAGAPIGQEMLSAAFWQAADRSPFARDTRLPSTETAVERELVALAPCRALEEGAQSCRLMFKHRDRLMGALGGSEHAVGQGDFTFVRQQQGWTTGASFNDEYARAVVRGRVSSVMGDEAAERFDEHRDSRQGDPQGATIEASPSPPTTSP